MVKKYCSLGTVFNVKLNIINICLNIIVFVENLKILNSIVIFKLILVGNHAKEKEVHFVLIYVLNFVIVENAGHVNIKEQLLSVIVEKLKEWQNVVNKEEFFNVEKNVRKY